MSSRHAEHYGEYSGVACIATLRLLASRFASQFQAATAAGNVHSLTSMPGGPWYARPVVGAFVHTLWISVWK